MKKIKNLVIRDIIDDLKYGGEIIKLIGGGIVFCGLVVYSLVYYNRDEQEQIVGDSIDYSEDTIDEEGHIRHEYLPGEHRIVRTRNDSFRYEVTAPDGYMIESVTVQGNLDRNQVVYVNIVPVIVQGTEQKDGTVTFDDFGEVLVNPSVKTLGSQRD